jgi:hypothetical protein
MLLTSRAILGLRSGDPRSEDLRGLAHTFGNDAEALRLYEQAAANAPTRGPDRARTFREWGMLLMNSGDPEATDLAIRSAMSVSWIAADRRQLSTFLTAPCSSSPLAIPPAKRSTQFLEQSDRAGWND